jgi:hypothetical protein
MTVTFPSQPDLTRVTPAPACEEHHVLKERFRAARRVYIQATADLENFKRGDFEKALKLAQRAQYAFAQAQEDLKRHITEHGCA